MSTEFLTFAGFEQRVVAVASVSGGFRRLQLVVVGHKVRQNVGLQGRAAFPAALVGSPG